MASIFQNLLFIDIESVSVVGDYAALSPRMQLLWQKKAKFLGAATEEAAGQLFFERAGIFAEFGKVVVIGLGHVVQKAQGEAPKLYVQALANENEKQLLLDFKTYLSQWPTRSPQLVGHNIKEFDLPYLARRMTVHGIPLPSALDIAGKKPWEVSHIDTMELWKFGDRKNYTSLDLLATLFDIPSSKEGIDGSEVNGYYHTKQDLTSIRDYCMRDVVTTMQVYRKLRQMPLIAADKIFRTGQRAQQTTLPL